MAESIVTVVAVKAVNVSGVSARFRIKSSSCLNFDSKMVRGSNFTY